MLLAALGFEITGKQIPSSPHPLPPTNLMYHTLGSINGKHYFFILWNLLLDIVAIEKNALLLFSWAQADRAMTF